MISTNPDLQALKIEKPGENMLGTHILLELHHCNQEVINHLEIIELILTSAAKVAGAEVIDRFFHRFDPHGISGVVVISTSHIAIHTWPEYEFAAIDIFTCGREMENDLAVSYIINLFKPKTWQMSQLPRGEFPLIKPATAIGCETVPQAPQGFPVKGEAGRRLEPFERPYSGEHHFFDIKRVVASGKTKYQHYSLIDTVSYGKMLFLDNCGQSSEKDEFIYHESLVQPAMLTHPKPNRVLVIGAGEGATAREILHHGDVERLVLVDLDEEVVELCKKHLPSFHGGAFDDPRVEIHYEDGLKFVENCREKFDVIVLDVVDDLEDTPAVKLYSPGFYAMLKSHCLEEGGHLVVQSMELSELEYEDHLVVYDGLKRTFNHVCSYHAFVPSFWAEWGYCLAGDDVDFLRISAAEFDGMIGARGLKERLRYMDGTKFTTGRALSKSLRRRLESIGGKS